VTLRAKQRRVSAISGISGVGNDAFERGDEDALRVVRAASRRVRRPILLNVVRAGPTPDLGRGGAWLMGKGVQAFQRGVAPEMGLSSESASFGLQKSKTYAICFRCSVYLRPSVALLRDGHLGEAAAVVVFEIQCDMRG
jgi:hypothetical protein